MKRPSYRRLLLLLLLPLGFGVLQLLRMFPDGVERFYSRGVYRTLAAVFGRLTSLFPFSLSGFCILLFLLVIVAAIPLAIHRHKQNAKQIYLARRGSPGVFRWCIINLCCIGACLYFIFALICGPNYQRLTFAQQSALEVRPSSAEELAALCTYQVEMINLLRTQMTEDDNGVMRLSEASYYQVARKAQQLYPNVCEFYPMLAGYVARPKPTIFSQGMSWLNISGIYVAFFFEPNVNVDIPDFNIPFTMMHEMSHFKGYMREDEANFIAYLACRYSEDPEFQYSGYMLAFIHTRNALYRADSDLYYEVMESLSPAIMRDITDNNQYWRRFEGPVAEVSNTVNDVYLKSNSQQSGVRSYGEMVDLLLAEYRTEHA